ncbi:MAG: hypothetical protein Q8K36_00570 [Alphaproteobacteria bacterium]|nr:hypothetical protein [Alphaproteobacteria bacterium]
MTRIILAVVLTVMPMQKFACNQPDVHPLKEQQDAYFVYIKAYNIYSVLEKISPQNVSYWIAFIDKQIQNYGKYVNKYNIKQALPSLSGLSLGKKRLVNYQEHQLSLSEPKYDMYVTYLTTTNPDSISKADKFGDPNMEPTSPIMMMTTIQVSKKFPWYSALGITRTIDEAVRMKTGQSSIQIDNQNKIPLNLYLYSWALLKPLYPHLTSMVSTPILKVRNIFKKYIANEWITIGQTLESEFRELPWVEEDPESFAFSSPAEPSFFKQPVITRVDVKAFEGVMDSNQIRG